MRCREYDDATNTGVVPAKAGTHNHRSKLSREAANSESSQNHSLGVWVPAFAGTTVVGTRTRPYVGDTALFSGAACGVAPPVSLAFSVLGQSRSSPSAPEPTMIAALMVKPVM